jgi:hypothetical protein
MVKCCCTGCNKVGLANSSDFFRFTKRDRGGITAAEKGAGNAYICNEHATIIYDYETRNTLFYGKPKAHNTTFSIENEMSMDSIRIRGELMSHGFIPCRDGSVEIEYKSPIYYGLNALSKELQTLEDVICEGYADIDDTCGTHLNIGKEWWNDDTFEDLKTFYHRLFTPLSNYLLENPVDCARLFGRVIDNGWSEPVNEATDPLDKYNIVNIRHETHIEFRICKFKNQHQYMEAVKCWNEILDVLYTRFIKYAELRNASYEERIKVIDFRRYKSFKQFLDSKADKAAERFIQIFKKYLANV